MNWGVPEERELITRGREYPEVEPEVRIISGPGCCHQHRMGHPRVEHSWTPVKRTGPSSPKSVRKTASFVDPDCAVGEVLLHSSC